MSVMNKLKKNSKVKFTSVLSESEFFKDREDSTNTKIKPSTETVRETEVS